MATKRYDHGMVEVEKGCREETCYDQYLLTLSTVMFRRLEFVAVRYKRLEQGQIEDKFDRYLVEHVHLLFSCNM